jgi:ribonuclease PH
MQRVDGRAPSILRPIEIERGFLKNPEGSALIKMGNTRVICAASVENGVPGFLRDSGQGWITAEYSMLPRSTPSRNRRETFGGPRGRTQEIQRLIGRALRSCVKMDMLGERSILIDCDVIEADGGTRTAAITGACVALHDALKWMSREEKIARWPFTGFVAAISVGVVDGEVLLDLCYEEDFKAAVDMNIVMNEKGEYIEVQGTAEEESFDRAALNKMLDSAEAGIKRIIEVQKRTLGIDTG